MFVNPIILVVFVGWIQCLQFIPVRFCSFYRSCLHNTVTAFLDLYWLNKHLSTRIFIYQYFYHTVFCCMVFSILFCLLLVCGGRLLYHRNLLKDFTIIWVLFIHHFSFLRSYDTLHRWHLLSIEQTEIMYYNFPDTTANFKKKLLQKQIFTKYVPLWVYPPNLNSILRNSFEHWMFWL